MAFSLGAYTLPLAVSLPSPPSTGRAGLADASGSWAWAEPGTYGLNDDGSGGWVWSASPQYRLDTTALTWVAA